ncbi:hypothetical protein EW146_g3503 [Bondarzewia mesenterica]|uniref:Enoyl reductase (ER) domain-containing protein n=1 Tax=Bondarzewia mesenterica TaxID=1095465 RepID=A0A4S4M389_9AGAM|nr:hypothetical protein EW146_g3503 [Bondarzewia mesenterica]
MSMRAVLVKDGKGPVENLYLGEVPRPVPGDDQVLVKIRAFGMNRMDISQREGKYPPPKGASEVLGVEFSGIIVEVGKGVTEWKVGDEVLGLAGGGAYAEYIVTMQTHVMKKSSRLSWTEAASIPENFLTAFQALVLVAEMHSNDDVLVHAGASGVGIAAIQLSRFFGANTVTATASTKEKLDYLLSLPAGATHVANYKTQDFSEVTKAATGGKGVDVVVDMVGQSHWARNIEALAVDGRMTVLAALSGPVVDKVNLGPILYKRLRIQGSTLRSRTVSYQTELISSQGEGPIRTYIHKVCIFLTAPAAAMGPLLLVVLTLKPNWRATASAIHFIRVSIMHVKRETFDADAAPIELSSQQEDAEMRYDSAGIGSNENKILHSAAPSLVARRDYPLSSQKLDVKISMVEPNRSNFKPFEPFRGFKQCVPRDGLPLIAAGSLGVVDGNPYSTARARPQPSRKQQFEAVGAGISDTLS